MFHSETKKRWRSQYLKFSEFLAYFKMPIMLFQAISPLDFYRLLLLVSIAWPKGVVFTTTLIA